MKKRKVSPLTTEQLVERKQFCAENNLCFVSKEALNHDSMALVVHPEVGNVLINREYA